MDAKDSIPKFTTQLGILPSDRALGTRPFQATGTDFADPVMYRNKNRREKKEHRLLSTCSLTRAINIQSMPNQTTDEFIRALKRLLQEDDFLEQYVQFLHGPRNWFLYEMTL